MGNINCFTTKTQSIVKQAGMLRLCSHWILEQPWADASLLGMSRCPHVDQTLQEFLEWPLSLDALQGREKWIR